MVIKVIREPPDHKMDIQLDYFWYEVPETPAERMQDAMQQLEVCVLRLGCVVRRLERAAEEQIDWLSAGSTMDDLQYHGETWLTAMYEFRERLSFLLAQLTGRDEETMIHRGGYKRRQEALKDLRKTMPTAADDIQALEEEICSSIKLRNIMTHEAFVHLAMFVDGNGPWEPDNALADLKHQDESSYRELREELDKAIQRFVSERKLNLERIEQRVSSLAEAVRRRGG